ncbi:c-type cytochrome [Cupriavidus nantongensis]|uniref:c-type cytochrome n=1 Tax=Cupriavidus nantongensis TaxID=1796606 RepID=UPI00224635D8|nr:hypothetical protein [Cupriavidus nantongensis]
MNIPNLIPIAVVSAVGLAAALSPVSANAQEAAPLVQKSNGMACHALDKKLVGPAFKECGDPLQGEARR